MNNMKLILNPEYSLYEKAGQVFCDSLQIAGTFEKEHKNVLRDINNIFEDDEFSRLNFELSSYKSLQNKKMPKYFLTKDGFTLLVMGYTGKQAMEFKKAYITRFNQMEAFIKSLQAAKLEFPAFTNAIMEAHEEPKHYHFSNEINMINRIVLGMDAKHFRESKGICKDVPSIRQYLEGSQLKAIEDLQRIDIGLIISGMDFENRKNTLQNTFARRYMKASKMLIEQVAAH